MTTLELLVKLVDVPDEIADEALEEFKELNKDSPDAVVAIGTIVELAKEVKRYRKADQRSCGIIS